MTTPYKNRNISLDDQNFCIGKKCHSLKNITDLQVVRKLNAISLIPIAFGGVELVSIAMGISKLDLISAVIVAGLFCLGYYVNLRSFHLRLTLQSSASIGSSQVESPKDTKRNVLELKSKIEEARGRTSE